MDAKSWYSKEHFKSLEHLNEFEKKSKDLDSKQSIVKKKSSSSSNSRNNFNIFEKFDTDFNQKANFLMNSHKSNKNLVDSFFNKCDDNNEMNVPSKLTKFILSLNSSKQIIGIPNKDPGRGSKFEARSSDDTPNKDDYSNKNSHMSWKKKEFESKSINSNILSNKDKLSEFNFNSLERTRKKSQFSKTSFNLDTPKKADSDLKEYFSPQKSGKKKLTSRSCAFSLSDLSKHSKSKNASIKNSNSRYKPNEVEMTPKSKTNQNLNSNIKIKNIVIDNANDKQTEIPQEKYVKVNKFNKALDKSVTNMNIQINNKDQQNMSMKGNTYNVHYNNIYNGHPVPLTPVMPRNNISLGNMNLMNPQFSNTAHQLHPPQNLPNMPHVPTNMSSFQPHPAMNPPPYMHPYHYHYNCNIC